MVQLKVGWRWKWRLGYWLLALVLPSTTLGSAEGLRLGVSDTDTAFPSYANYNPGNPDEPLTGGLIDFWRCVINDAAVPPVFVRRPLLRLRHELIHGQLDLQLSSFKGPAQQRLVEHNGLQFSAAFLHTYVSLLVRAPDAALLQDGRWQQEPIGVVKQSMFHRDLQALGGVIGLRANSFDQLLKQLISGRVALIALPLSWSGEGTRKFMGVSVSGRTLIEKSLHAIVSRQKLQAEPQLLARIDKRIPTCQPALATIQRNVLPE